MENHNVARISSTMAAMARPYAATLLLMAFFIPDGLACTRPRGS